MALCFEDFGIDLDSQLMSGTTDFKNRKDSPSKCSNGHPDIVKQTQIKSRDIRSR